MASPHPCWLRHWLDPNEAQSQQLRSRCNTRSSNPNCSARAPDKLRDWSRASQLWGSLAGSTSKLNWKCKPQVVHGWSWQKIVGPFCAETITNSVRITTTMWNFPIPPHVDPFFRPSLTLTLSLFSCVYIICEFISSSSKTRQKR